MIVQQLPLARAALLLPTGAVLVLRLRSSTLEGIVSWISSTPMRLSDACTSDAWSAPLSTEAGAFAEMPRVYYQYPVVS